MRPTTRGIGWCLIEESAQIGSFISLEMGKWDLKESKRKYFSKITYGNWAHLVFLRLWRAESKSNYHKPLLEKTTNDQWNGVTISRKILLFIGKKQMAQSARTKKALSYFTRIAITAACVAMFLLLSVCFVARNMGHFLSCFSIIS